MKNKLRILPILAILCLIIATVCFAACDKNADPVSVSLDFDGEQGFASLSDPQNGTEYLKGESVTLTVTPKSGYATEKVEINGERVTLTKGELTFTLSKDTVINVKFTSSLLIVENNEEKGAVSLSSPQNGEYYVQGEQVTVSITPKNHFTLSSVLKNGVEASFTNNKAIVTIGEEQTVLEILYIGDPISTGALGSLQNNVRFTGEYFYETNSDEYESAHNTIDTVFGTDVIKQVEKDFETGEIYYDSVIIKSKEDPRAIAFIQRTINNEVVEVTNKNYYYSDYANQFDVFTENDFEYVSDGVYAFLDGDKAKRAASAITGWNESIDTFTLHVQDEKVVAVEFVTTSIETGVDGVTYVSSYHFDVVEHGTAQVDLTEIKPYERTAEHDALENALINAENAAFYTVNHFAHEVGYVEPEGGETRPGYGDINYNVYVTEDMIYDSYPTEEHGYKVLNDYVYPFNYESADDRIVLLDPVIVDGISALQATFRGFSVELFECVGDGKYVLRDNELASEIVEMLGEGNEKRYYSYAVSLAITVENDKIYKIEFVTKTYGLSEEITLTYDFETAIELDLDFDNASKESVLDPFKGTYADSEGNYAVVDAGGFTINGISATTQSYDSAEGVFTLLWNNMTIYVKKISLKQMFVTSEDYSFATTFTMLGSQTVLIPQDFRGVWEGVFEDDIGREEYRFEIQSYVVKFYGVPVKVLSYTDTEGLICEDDNGNTFMFGYVEYSDGTGFTVIHIKQSGETIPCILELTGEELGVEIPIEFVGTYLARNDSSAIKRVDITTATITVDGVEFIPKSYNAAGQMFTGTLGDNANYTIGFGYSVDQLVVGPNGEQLYRTEVILPMYIGTWQSQDGDYLVEITETDICINGNYVNFTLDEYGYTFEMPDSAFTTHIIYLSSGTDGKITLWLYDNYDLLKFLTKVGGESDTKFPAYFMGTWTGTTTATEQNVATKYTFTITEEGVSLSINDGEFITADEAYYDDGAIIATFGNAEYVISKGATDDVLCFYSTVDGERGDFVPSLVKVEEETD